MLTATDFNTQLEQAAHLGAQATFTTMLAQLEEQSGFDFPDDLERDLRAILVEHMEGYVEAIRPTALEDAARIYARYFTAEEIRELQRLQTSPVMVKFNRIAPQFMAELMQVGMATELERTAELERRMAEAVEAWAVRNERYGQPPSS